MPSMRIGECRQNSDDGFTLIELIVVVFIAGILASIALPSMLRFANRAKESEARTYVSAVNKAQQLFYYERNRFSEDLANLGVAISSNTNYYTYTPNVDNANGIANTEATPTTDLIRGFTGKVWLGTPGQEVTMRSLLCTGSAGVAPTITGTTCP